MRWQWYSRIYGFALCCRLLPLFCGVISDKLLGKRKSMVWGCLLHVVGLSLVAMPYHVTLFIGMAVFVTGNGFFGGVYKAMLGDFYDEIDAVGKDAGYTIMYGLFNVGIYLGDNKFLHSPKTGDQVRVEEMDVAYWKKRFNGATRIEVSSANRPETK